MSQSSLGAKDLAIIPDSASVDRMPTRRTNLIDQKATVEERRLGIEIAV